MASVTRMATDLVEELVLRRWARENYVASEQRDESWHPIVLEEMRHKDQELADEARFALSGRRIVPLVPDAGWILHGPHAERPEPAVLLRVPALPAE